MNPEEVSLMEAAAAIRDGVLSPVEYVNSLFARIDQVDSRVQAWVTVDRDEVLAEARRSEAEAQKKQFRGPLHGIPVGIKDIFYTRNLRTTMGSMLFENFIPGYDARAVTRLKEAGAIVLGKTVTTVFANLDPGPTRNPWNLAHTPGGSSSGSAAVVTALNAPKVAAQTPSPQPVPVRTRAGYVYTANRESHNGPMDDTSRQIVKFVNEFSESKLTAPDIDVLNKIMLDAMTEFPVQKQSRGSAFRIGVVRGFFYENATSEARSLNDALGNTLANSGFVVEEAQLPAIFDLAQPILRTILRSEVASVHEQLFRAHPESYREKLRALVETGMLLDATQYLRARRIRQQYRRDMARLFEKFDGLMTPVATGTAPEGIGSTGVPVMNAPWTLADFPTMTLPHALGSNGLPIGVQFSSPPLQEGLLLEMGKAIESVVAFRASPSL